MVGASGGIGEGKQALLDRFGVKSAARTVNSVATYLLTPNDIPAENCNRLLVHVRGSCYVMGRRRH
jgi:epsilon-lactone hydrolase